MDAGINQLVDTYKGNPAPLQQRVQQKDQQDPGPLPPDLEEAIALQKIAELRKSVQNQQAMQVGGAQPTIMAKLRQMLGGAQPQAQMAQANTQGQVPMPAQPVRAATGGSIAHLSSNLGRHYAGGGIIAFNSRGEVKDPNKSEDRPDYSIPEMTKSELYAKALAAAQGDKPEPSNEDIKKALAFVSAPAAAGLDVLLSPLKFLANTSFRSPLSTEPLANYTTAMDARNKYLYGEKPSEGAPAAKPPAVVATPLSDIRSQLNKADAAQFAEKPAPKPPAAPAAPRPPAAPSVAAPQKLDPNSLRALAEKYIRDEMALNPETESDKMVARGRKIMGLDDLLAEKTQRANAREQAIEQAKANRTPDWIRGLQAAGGAPVRGGIGMLLNRVGSEMANTRETYAAQDLAYQAELDRLRDVITDAKISGNKELAKEAMAAYKEVDVRRKAALTSATSLLNTDEQAATRLQIAREGAANRAVQNAGAADQRKMANAINAVKSDEVINRLQKRAEELGKMPTAANRAEAENIMKQIDNRQNAIYKRFGVLEDLSTIAPAPGAASPGGTTTGWGKASVVK